MEKLTLSEQSIGTLVEQTTQQQRRRSAQIMTIRKKRVVISARLRTRRAKA